MGFSTGRYFDDPFILLLQRIHRDSAAVHKIHLENMESAIHALLLVNTTSYETLDFLLVILAIKERKVATTARWASPENPHSSAIR